MLLKRMPRSSDTPKVERKLCVASTIIPSSFTQAPIKGRFAMVKLLPYSICPIKQASVICVTS